MTVILGFKVNTLPVLIGDVVISGDEQPDVETVIPTVGTSRAIFPEGSGYTITDLKQKVNIISENLMIAWAGSYSAAKYVISELKRLNEHQEFSQDFIHTFFSEEVSQNIGQQEVAFIGCIYNSNHFTFFHYSYGVEIKKLNHPRYGEMLVCGVGVDDVQAILQAIERQSTRDDLNQFHNIVIETLPLYGYLIARDEQSLLNFFGGGYEIATFPNNKFSKVSDYSFFYWFSHEDQNGKLDLVTQAYKTVYSDDILLIYSIQIKQIKTANGSDGFGIVFPIDKIVIYPILPIYSNMTEEQVIEQIRERIPILESSLNCDFIFVVNMQLEKPLNLKRVIPIPTHYTDSQNSHIKFDMTHDVIQLKVENSWLDEIKASLLVSYSQKEG
jgi:hypothetical protein